MASSSSTSTAGRHAVTVYETPSTSSTGDLATIREVQRVARIRHADVSYLHHQASPAHGGGGSGGGGVLTSSGSLVAHPSSIQSRPRKVEGGASSSSASVALTLIGLEKKLSQFEQRIGWSAALAGGFPVWFAAPSPGSLVSSSTAAEDGGGSIPSYSQSLLPNGDELRQLKTQLDHLDALLKELLSLQNRMKVQSTGITTVRHVTAANHARIVAVAEPVLDQALVRLEELIAVSEEAAGVGERVSTIRQSMKRNTAAGTTGTAAGATGTGAVASLDELEAQVCRREAAFAEYEKKSLEMMQKMQEAVSNAAQRLRAKQ